MALIHEIQQGAVDSKVSLGDVLRQCKVLAHSLKNETLMDWVESELNGYDSKKTLPDYRIIRGLPVLGNFVGPAGSGVKNAPIIKSNIPKQARNVTETFLVRHSVYSLMELAASTDDSFKHRYPPELSLLVHQYEFMQCMEMWQYIPKYKFVEVLETIRSKLLDFALELSNVQGVEEIDFGKRVNVPSATVTQIVNQTFFGGNHTFAGRVENLNLSQIQMHDFESLADALKQLGLPETEIGQLEDAMEHDPEPQTPQTMGKKISTWIKKNAGKVANAGGKITTEAASELLVKAISKYYGLP